MDLPKIRDEPTKFEDIVTLADKYFTSESYSKAVQLYLKVPSQAPYFEFFFYVVG